MAPVAAGAQALSGDGFMFGAPRASFTLKAGYTRPSEGSDLYSFVRNELSIGRGDFAGGSFAGELNWSLSERLAMQMGLGLSSRTVPSVYRNWIDNNNQEIEQSTILRRMPLSVGLRYYLTSPGRSVGRLAWVPARFAPYASAGAGMTWYSFKQAGDFVDFRTNGVFYSSLTSAAWTPSVYGALGAEYALSARTGIVAEARYDYAKGRMSSDYSGFNRIDLSGVAATVGLTFRF